MSDTRLTYLLQQTQLMINQNRKLVSLKKLEEVIQGLIDEGEVLNGNFDELLTQLQHESNLSEYEQEHEWSRRMFDSCITLGGLALKSAILINGGAAVATLAYLGKLPFGSDYGLFPYAMLLFVTGVLCSSVATGTGYLYQFALGHKKDLYVKLY